MGLISSVLLLPVAPIRVVVKLGELIQQQAEHELHDRSAARRQLEELEEARAAGRISEEDEIQQEHVILQHMVVQPGRGDAAEPGSEDQEG
jgi:cytochrome c-type biogenesis protein CcmH/NrfG